MASLHRRSWVSAFLDLADMGGRRLGAFFLDGWRIICMIHFLFLGYQRSMFLDFVPALRKNAPLLSTSCFFFRMPRGGYWKGQYQKGTCSRGDQTTLDVDGWEREALKSLGFSRDGTEGNKKGDTCWNTGLGLWLMSCPCGVV